MCRDSAGSRIACLSDSEKKFVINNSSQRGYTDVGYRECAGKKTWLQELPLRILSSLYLEEKSDRKLYENTCGPYLARHPGGMVLWAAILFLHGAGFVGETHLFLLFFHLKIIRKKGH